MMLMSNEDINTNNEKSTNEKSTNEKLTNEKSSDEIIGFINDYEKDSFNVDFVI